MEINYLVIILFIFLIYEETSLRKIQFEIDDLNKTVGWKYTRGAISAKGGSINKTLFGDNGLRDRVNRLEEQVSYLRRFE